jgi:hypothetical protein
MAKQQNKDKTKEANLVTTTNSNLPGLDGVKVIVSQPSLVRENSSKITKK